MPLPVLNFSGYKTNSLTPPDLMQSLQQGIQTGFMPRQLNADLQRQQLANALQKINLQYAPEMTQAELAYKQAQTPNLQAQTGLTNQQAQYYGQSTLADIAYKQAQTKRENMLASLPFGGANLPGVAGSIQGLETVKQLYGENSPQYETAKRQFDLEQQKMSSMINYQNALTETMPVRYTTPLGKQMIEQANVMQGNAPTGLGWNQQINPPGGNPYTMGPASQSQNQQMPPQIPPQIQNQISPMQSAIAQQQPMQPPVQNPLAPATAKTLADQYELKRLKDTTDTDTRQRNLFATNLEKTFDNINIDDLVKFSGVKGMIEFNKQRVRDSFGQPVTEEYKKFKESLNAAGLAAAQIRNFYKESIQPGMREELKLMTNPSSWMNSPETAKRVFQSTKKIMGQEMGTYRGALKSTSVYKGEKEESNKNEQFISQKVIGGKNYVQTPDGKWYEK